jgi:hypothetical protein
MFATQSGIAQHQQRPWEYFGENPDVSSINQKEDFANFPFFLSTKEIFSSRFSQFYFLS